MTTLETDMRSEEIQKELFKIQDVKYRDFQAKLIPTVRLDTVIGVRTPELRAFAKQLVKEGGYEPFLLSLPHQYFDENQLHIFILSELKDYNHCIEEVNRFLPYVDNWATCDQLSPKMFKKHKTELLKEIKVWLRSDKTYTVRFAIGCLMQYFLAEDFDESYPKLVSNIRSDEYYINMMIAWYFSTALAKRYEEVIPYIEQQKLDVWTHNKAIQKAVESYRITDEQKGYLKSLKVKNK